MAYVPGCAFLLKHTQLQNIHRVESGTAQFNVTASTSRQKLRVNLPGIVHAPLFLHFPYVLYSRTFKGPAVLALIDSLDWIHIAGTVSGGSAGVPVVPDRCRVFLMGVSTAIPAVDRDPAWVKGKNNRALHVTPINGSCGNMNLVRKCSGDILKETLNQVKHSVFFTNLCGYGAMSPLVSSMRRYIQMRYRNNIILRNIEGTSTYELAL